MQDKFKEFIKLFTKIIQYSVNLFLIVLTLLLIVLLCKETSLMVDLTINSSYDKHFYKGFLESLLTFFIYFEFVIMIIKYFKEGYHFPLRYFMYIGITATIRVIIVDHENGLDTLYFALSILSLVIGYGVISMLAMLKKKWKLEDE